MNMNKCPKFVATIHNLFAQAREAECTCDAGVGCNYVDPRACKACGWVNNWTDSGDRGAAQCDHDRRCKG
jgi:hypothetical protein